MNIDIARYAAGEPDCVLTQTKKPKQNIFYEIYLSISYEWSVSDSTINRNISKLFAVISLLEKEHYYCKISLVFPDRNCNIGEGNSNLLVVIPVFSHREVKTLATLSAVINPFTLRKWGFNLLEEKYGDNLASGYGRPVDLPLCYNIGRDIDVGRIAEEIMNKHTTPCESR